MKLKLKRVTWGYIGAICVLIFASPNKLSIILCIPFLVLGLIIRNIAAGTLLKQKELATVGIYSYMRHPLYVGSTLLGIGFMIMAANIYLTILCLIIFIYIYNQTVKREEQSLQEEYGEQYIEYCHNINAFIPKLQHIDFYKIISKFNKKRWLKNREYNSILGTSILFILLCLKWLICGS